MMESSVKKCIKCDDGTKDNDKLNSIGLYFKPSKNKTHPLCTLIDQATELSMWPLVEKLKHNLTLNLPTHIHFSCRMYLKNQSRPSKKNNTQVNVSSSVITRSDEQFDFKIDCFYCGKKCEIDTKHPDRKSFHLVATKDTKIHAGTLELCQRRNDPQSRAILGRIQSVNDLFAADARYHKSCRSTFETESCHEVKGRPQSISKSEAFENLCVRLEEDIEPMTVKEFHEALTESGSESYCIKSIKNKLTKKYGDDVQFVNRFRNSNVIILSNNRKLLTDQWYEQRKLNKSEEEERIVITAAKILKNKIKNHEISVDSYPTLENITNGGHSHVPPLLKLFVDELIRNPLKQESISQSIVSGTRPRVIMPLQFALAVTVDNRYASKELNVLLSRLGFACSYDEVIRYKQNVIKHDSTDEVICPAGTESLMFVGDNTDHDLATMDGKNTHHGLGSIAISNGHFSGFRTLRRPLPRDEKVAWSQFEGNSGIPIKSYKHPNQMSLKLTTMSPCDPTTHESRFLYMLSGISRSLSDKSCNWAGYMSELCVGQTLERSVVSVLPIINLPSTDMNALYSLLSFVTNEASKLNIPTPTITFDQPLYVKAYEIVESTKLNIFVRLGGFHQLMSFLGSIGRLMEGSGLRTALEEVYAPLAVNHMLSGKAYARALRGHLLVSSALLSLCLEDFIGNLTAEELQQLRNIYNSSNPEEKCNETVAEKLMKFYNEKEGRLSATSRTSKLWFSYLRYINVVQMFIEAERTHNWLQHVHATKLMLNLYAATGHNNYAKTCRLYLQSISTLEDKYPDIHEQLLKGNHTVRRTEKPWSGIWTDLSIEQILMKSLKGRSGVVSKGITENVLNVWTKSMHRCAEVAGAMDELISSNSSSDEHKEHRAGRSMRDTSDCNKLLVWFREHNPFECNEKLVALDSGLVDDQKVLNCDEAEEIGSMINRKCDNSSFAECSFRRKDQIKNIQSLHSKVNVGKQEVSIDPHTLFLRLAFAIERKPDTVMVDYFEYELTPYPTSLFKDGLMRLSGNKSQLKNHILKPCIPCDLPEGTVIADGGALLWSVMWSKQEKFQYIAQKYLGKCRDLKVNTVVFDGYEPSTKDGTRRSRYSISSKVVEVASEKCCPSDTNEFLSNVVNKCSLISFLGRLMEQGGIKVVYCKGDADTTIVKEALVDDAETVVVLADDTDVFCLLLHHAGACGQKNIYLSSMRTCSKTHERTTYDIRTVTRQNNDLDVMHVLFAHAFSGCDTTSCINRLGKTQILKKLNTLSELRDLADKFYCDTANPDSIGNATVRIFQLLYCSSQKLISSLASLRKEKYVNMIATDRSTIDPSSLPPSPRAAYFHGLRVYHQVTVWRKLSPCDIDPLRWGWDMKEGKYVATMTDLAAAPQDVMKLIRCGCKVACGRACSCVKVGLKCTHLCKECNGETCGNASITTTDAADEEIDM